MQRITVKTICGSELIESLTRRAHGDEDLHKYIECTRCPYGQWEERKEA